jgi:pimeloyl-ACP methyl ester carboxylesterase
MPITVANGLEYFAPPDPSSARKGVLFSTATGIVSQLYHPILQEWASLWNAHLFAHDYPGFGASPESGSVLYQLGKPRIWDVLQMYVKKAFWNAKSHLIDHHSLPPNFQWTLAGHSLGGWLSMQVATSLFVKEVVALDIPILTYQQDLAWSLASQLGFQGLHPLAKSARHRKLHLGDPKEAVRYFKKNAFFQGWPEETILQYIQFHYQPLEKGTMVLGHDSHLESDIFESQPRTFLSSVPFQKNWNETLTVRALYGKESPFCHAKAKRELNALCGTLHWQEVPGRHMFVFSHPQEFLELLNKQKS